VRTLPSPLSEPEPNFAQLPKLYTFASSALRHPSGKEITFLWYPKNIKIPSFNTTKCSEFPIKKGTLAYFIK
jgi:hypothetical protein